MRKEKWIQICKIQGFEEIKDYYWLSNSDTDTIVNRNTGKRLKPYINHGYLLVKLMTNQGKTRNCKMHILKAKAFIHSPNPLAYDVVRHLNDIRTDNRLENLAWGNQSDNMKDCVRNGKFNYSNITMAVKKISKPVKCIETGIIYPSAYDAKRKLGISDSSISHCCRGKRHITGGFHWTYVNEEVNDDDMECK